MGRISLEIVARSEESFAKELEVVRTKFPDIGALNIPDILKYDVRISEACSVAVRYFSSVIPHIRAVAINKELPFSYKEFFEANNINEVLVILGDNPEIVSKSENPCDSIDLIKKIKKEMPDMTVYAGLDQWRTSFEEEMDYVRRKIEAGADGFFTQPFFEIDTMERYAKELENIQIFWGLAPVIRESSKKYWENKNKVVFPENFKCTMEWNQVFAREILKRTTSDNSHVYFCPITVDFVEYLKGIF